MKAKWKRAATMTLALGLLSPMVMGASLFNWTGGGDGISWEDVENWDQSCPGSPCTTQDYPGQNSSDDDANLKSASSFTVDIITETIDKLKVFKTDSGGTTNVTVTSDGSGANTLTCDTLRIDANRENTTLTITDLATIQTVD